MKLKINKNRFIDKFLSPISNVTDMAVVNITFDRIHTLVSNDDATIILYAKYKHTTTDINENKIVTLNIPDVKRLIQVFKCIQDDDIELTINTNNIYYKSSSVKFKYHLLDDGIIQKVAANVDKIKKLTFDCKFNLTTVKLSEIIKGSMFTADTNKIYFYTKDGNVYCELSDRTIKNSDMVDYQISNEYKGSDIEMPVPVHLDIFRILSSLRTDLLIKFNTKINIMSCDIVDNITTLKYVIPTLVK